MVEVNVTTQFPIRVEAPVAERTRETWISLVGLLVVVMLSFYFRTHSAGCAKECD
jgi:hypothetical protein